MIAPIGEQDPDLLRRMVVVEFDRAEALRQLLTEAKALIETITIPEARKEAARSLCKRIDVALSG